mmetsp:Transcript_3120/g.11911  ORF Transcript_3120/g.11911 Transcript_3120/m.11911 type:complete len:318 (-) Transcript_3120:1112-2065(-)
MLKVELHSAILEEAIGSRLLGGKREPCELAVSDFDECQFKVVVLPGEENVVTLHAHVPCFDALAASGARDVLETEYAGMVGTPDAGFQVALRADADALGGGPPAEAALAKLMKVKRHLVGAPLKKAFEALVAGTSQQALPSALALRWRKTEAIYVSSGPDPARPTGPHDRVAVVFSIAFPEEADRAYCRVFLQQFQEMQRKVNNAPPFVFSEPAHPPAEIRGVVGPADAASPDLVGFATFTIFTQHCKTPEKLDKTVDLLLAFRNYLHFHIKACKTALHMRMRKKVDAWKQILNRAAMTSAAPKEMKTASGKTFTRK